MFGVCYTVTRMNTYIVTCRQPDGNVVERRVKARDHRAAQVQLAAEGMTDVVVVDRETRADRHVNRTVKGVVFALVVGLVAAGIGLWWFWRTFERFFQEG